MSPDAARFARRFAPPLLLIVAGCVVAAAAGGSTALSAIGFALAGAGAIWAVSAAFYEVGRSEDRYRERRPRG